MTWTSKLAALTLATAVVLTAAIPAGAADGTVGKRETVCARDLFVRVTAPDGAWMGRPLSLPAFSEPASDAPVPAQAGGRRLMPVEQGADFRQPRGEPEPAPARRPLAPGGLTFSDPDRHI